MPFTDPIVLNPATNTHIATTVSANVLYQGIQYFPAGVYTISCAPASQASVYFYSGTTLIGTAVTSSGTVNLTLAADADTVWFESNANNLPIQITLIGLPIGSITTIPFPIVDWLVLAGGGGGGFTTNSRCGGGGGGAGGCLTGSGMALSIGTIYAITVGAGGAGATTLTPVKGQNSVFNGQTAIGGGGGACTSGGGGGATSGGSGGGGEGDSQLAGAAGTAGQGFAGGNGNSTTNTTTGGGGGAGAIGQNGTGTTNGDGGVGLASSISGAAVTYGGGGGGGGHGQDAGIINGGSGGSGGGANGGTNGVGASAAANTGGGGGGAGARYNLGNTNGGAGGSGVVILRYPNSYPDPASTTGAPTVTNVGGFKIYTFTGSGSITF